MEYYLRTSTGNSSKNFWKTKSCANSSRKSWWNWWMDSWDSLRIHPGGIWKRSWRKFLWNNRTNLWKSFQISFWKNFWENGLTARMFPEKNTCRSLGKKTTERTTDKIAGANPSEIPRTPFWKISLENFGWTLGGISGSFHRATLESIPRRTS